MSDSQGYPAIPEQEADEREHRRRLARAVNTINQGKFNCTIDFVVTANATTTTILDPRCSAFSFYSVMAFDANGAADIAAGTYYTAFNSGSVIFHHRSSASVRSLRLLILS